MELSKRQAAVDALFAEAEKEDNVKQLVTVAERGLAAPESLSLAEIKSICQAVLAAMGQTES